MRDPNRIDYILEQIRVAWHKSPEFRLGQLIVCATAPKNDVPEIFGIEDEQLLENIQGFAKSLENATVYDPKESNT